MNAYDFSPLFRTAIGFDRLARLVDAAARTTEGNGYPPYNIEKTGEDTYVLTMAVAGFGPQDIEITARENTLTVAGKAPQETEGRAFLHRGIAGRAFERRFVGFRERVHAVLGQVGGRPDEGERQDRGGGQRARGKRLVDAPPYRHAEAHPDRRDDETGERQ